MRPERFELPTKWRKAAPFEATYSIQLSYGRAEDELYRLLLGPELGSGFHFLALATVLVWFDDREDQASGTDFLPVWQRRWVRRVLQPVHKGRCYPGDCGTTDAFSIQRFRGS